MARPALAQSAEAKSKVDPVELQLKDAEERLGFVEQEYVQRKDATDEQQRQERFAKGASSFADADYNSRRSSSTTWSRTRRSRTTRTTTTPSTTWPSRSTSSRTSSARGTSSASS